MICLLGVTFGILTEELLDKDKDGFLNQREADGWSKHSAAEKIEDMKILDSIFQITQDSIKVRIAAEDQAENWSASYCNSSLGSIFAQDLSIYKNTKFAAICCLRSNYETCCQARTWLRSG